MNLYQRTQFFFPLILSVSLSYKQICSFFTLTKNIVKWQFEKISSQAPNSAYIIDKNKCITGMWCIVHAVQTVETYLGFSKSVRRSRRKRNPNDSVLLSTWCSFRQKHVWWYCYILVFLILLLAISVGWSINAQVLHQRDLSGPRNKDWCCLLNKFVCRFQIVSCLGGGREQHFLLAYNFQLFWIFSYFKVTAFML